MDFYAACRASPVPLHGSGGTIGSVPQTESPHAKDSHDSLRQQHLALSEQHEKLKRHFDCLSETVKVLGDQSSQTTRVAQKAQDAKLDLAQRHSNLQEKFNGLKSTVQTLTQRCKAADDQLLLQSQLHADKLRLMEVAHNTLKDRCRAMGVSAEQHRVANLKLEERHKSMSKDLELLADWKSDKPKSLASIQTHKALKSEVSDLSQGTGTLGQREMAALKSRISAHRGEIQLLAEEYAGRLHGKETEVSSLQSEINSHTTEARQLKGKLDSAKSLLRAHPTDPCLSLKTKALLQSSAEILELAHARGGSESMRQCLGQVAAVLQDLNGQLDSHRRLSSAWLDQVGSL